MTFLKVLIYNLMFIIVKALFTDKCLPSSNINLLSKTYYDIKFALYIDDNIFYGEYNVNSYIPYKTQNIYFYTENLGITGVMVINDTQISENNEGEVFAHKPKELMYNTETYINTISFPYELSQGCYIINMKFIGLLAENGGFRSFYINNFLEPNRYYQQNNEYFQQNNRIWLAATHYHKFATRRLFPLLKDININTNFKISIKHHINYTALSNMPMQAVNRDKNNMKWTHFESTPVMPENMIAAGVAPLTSTLNRSYRVILWCRKGVISYSKLALLVANGLTVLLESKWPYIREIPEINHVTLPNLLGEEEEIKLGFVLHRESDIIFNQEDSEIRKTEITQLIGYKVAHEWFFHIIDPSKWDPWLSKGLATFFGIYIADEKFPKYQVEDFFVVQMQHDVLHWNTKNTWPLKSRFNSSFEIPRFIKASIMFRTLHHIFMKEIFQTGIQEYILAHYTGSDDFWNIAQSSLDKSSVEIKYNVKDRIANWGQLKYYPVINVKRNYNNNRLNISVENFDTDIWIYMNITTQTHYNLRKYLPAVWLTPHISYHILNIDFINKNDWVLVNLQQIGCYRVNYDDENWNRLSKYLNSTYFKKIDVLDRAKIIDDTFHFLMTGRLNFTVFLDISYYLWRDRDYIAWYPMFKNLEYVLGFFAFPESAPIKRMIMQPLIKILSKIRYPNFERSKINQGKGFLTYLREETARWLCIIDYTDCLMKAYYKLKSYLSKRDTFLSNTIWTGWKEWTFCNGLKTANNNTWMKVYYMYKEEFNNDVLKFLACSQNNYIIRSYIRMMRSNFISKIATVLDLINTFTSIVARHAKNDTIFDFIIKDLWLIKPKEINLITALTIIINHVYSKEQINKIKKYVEINFKDNLKLVINDEYHDENDVVIKSLLLKENIESMIMYINRKLELRWHQIKTQLYEFRYLATNLSDILEKNLND
ncbi:aminopeptidase N-like [Camponotus floridanus]|uniref:aminopeptidase N-like n=1 Tax=Camponotus floridanus TaxID=104421 RepID=UPI000DC67DC1|nr:aminopeptidase N-like [Camponotus floridanus]